MACFYLADAAASLRGNLSTGSTGDDVLAHPAAGSGNTWDTAGASRLSATTDPASAPAARRPDGALPATGFLTTGTTTGAAPMTES